LTLCDYPIALKGGEVLSDCIVSDTESFRQVFDGQTLLVVEEQSEQLLLSESQ